MPETVESPEPISSRRRRGVPWQYIGKILRPDWRPSLRWFAAEFLVVVTGVLVALALNAWWAERQDRRSERSYLRQLLSDARRNEHLLQLALEEDSASLRALERLSGALRTGEAPGGGIMDTMGVALRYSDPRPVSGTLDHLIGSGRVELIRADSLRLAVIEYSSLIHADLAEQSRHVDLLLSSMRSLLSRQHAAGLDCAMFVESSPSLLATCDADVRRVWPALSGDPEYRAAVLGARVAAWNRVFYLDRMARETQQFRRLLEGEVGGAASR